jgi:hypothetical protein
MAPGTTPSAIRVDCTIQDRTDDEMRMIAEKAVKEVVSRFLH